MMPDQSKVTVIYNPVAGAKRKIDVPALIREQQAALNQNLDITLKATEGPQHATALALEAVAAGSTRILAAGGDGTLNEVAQGLLGTEVPMGILPLGSGNGLARHLGVPLDKPAAVRHALTGTTMTMDAVTLNGQHYFCTAGIGYDAEVAKTFAQVAAKRGRGLVNYLYAGWIAYNRFKPVQVELEIDGQERNLSVFSLTVANAGQFGNNAIISKQADVTDGWLDVCIVHPFAWLKGAEMTGRLFAGTLPGSPLYETIRAKRVTIKRSAEGWLHYDGEPQVMPAALDFQVKPAQLQVVARPENQKIG